MESTSKYVAHPILPVDLRHDPNAPDGGPSVRRGIRGADDLLEYGPADVHASLPKGGVHLIREHVPPVRNNLSHQFGNPPLKRYERWRAGGDVLRRSAGLIGRILDGHVRSFLWLSSAVDAAGVGARGRRSASHFCARTCRSCTALVRRQGRPSGQTKDSASALVWRCASLRTTARPKLPETTADSKDATPRFKLRHFGSKDASTRLRMQQDFLVCLSVAGASKHLGGCGPFPEGFSCGEDGVLCNNIDCKACRPDFAGTAREMAKTQGMNS